jgi:hypothetical protein
MPANFTVPSGPSNSEATFLLPDGRHILQCQPFARCTAGGDATCYIRYNAFTPTDVDIYSKGEGGSAGGSGLSSLGGVLRLGELRPGQQGPRHTVRLLVDGAVCFYNATTVAETFTWPAVTGDSGAVTNYGSIRSGPSVMRMGALLAIPPSVDIDTLGLVTEPARQLAWTAQNYGFYPADTQGNAFGFAVQEGWHGSFVAQFQADYGFAFEDQVHYNHPWCLDLQLIIRQLYVVTNNSPSTTGGGGTPRQPLAPAIAP